jgi:hypothetical protein
MGAPFKNLTSPASNSGVGTQEKIAPIPHRDDPRVNGDRADDTLNQDGKLPWGPSEPLPGGATPYKNLK